jgi:hypothetical protein
MFIWNELQQDDSSPSHNSAVPPMLLFCTICNNSGVTIVLASSRLCVLFITVQVVFCSVFHIIFCLHYCQNSKTLNLNYTPIPKIIFSARTSNRHFIIIHSSLSLSYIQYLSFSLLFATRKPLLNCYNIDN